MRVVSNFGALALASCACQSGEPADGGLDAPLDTPVDAIEIPSDAVFGPPRQAWLNPSPPVCARRENPPRWRVTADPGPVGSVRWVRSLGERDFVNWVRALGPRPPAYRRIAPSLTGDGIASWIFVAESGQNQMIGFSYEEGRWAHYGPAQDSDVPRIWLPNAYFIALGSTAMNIVAPEPPDFYTPPPPPSSMGNLPGFWGEEFFVGALGWNAMPAWSPATGDTITFGRNTGSTVIGVGAGCAEGHRWFTEIPAIHFDTAVNFVRPDGDVIVTSLNRVWVLDGETGEPLRLATIGDNFANSVAYQPGCGVLVELPTETTKSWYWLNDDTLEHGPDLRLPADRPTGISGWAGTADCGFVASAGTGNVVRLKADGSVRFNTPIPAGTGITIASPPIVLSDDETLLMVDPPGWMRLTATGEVDSIVRLDTSVVGLRSAGQTTLAPDGTMYFMTRSGTALRFGAASTGAIPGPYLWPRSGLNWARTNSILPD